MECKVSSLWNYTQTTRFVLYFCQLFKISLIRYSMIVLDQSKSKRPDSNRFENEMCLYEPLTPFNLSV